MSPIRLVLGVVIAAVVAVSACGGEPVDDAQDGSVVAAQTVVRVPEIRLLDLATGSSRTLVAANNLTAFPSWSPDGRQIAFNRLESGGQMTGDPDLWVVDVATGERRHVTAGPEGDVSPTWTTDGRGLVFVRGIDAESADIWKIDLDSGALTQLTDDPWRELLPAVSPDGTTVMYVNERGPRQLWTVDIEGAGPPRRLLADEVDATFPAYSPTSHEIVFRREEPNMFPELWITALEGRAEPRRVRGLVSPGRPSWSPDGRSIVISEEADGHLYRVDLDSGEITQLTVGDGEDVLPAWSPDGRQIVYIAYPGLPRSD